MANSKKTKDEPCYVTRNTVAAILVTAVAACGSVFVNGGPKAENAPVEDKATTASPVIAQPVQAARAETCWTVSSYRNNGGSMVVGLTAKNGSGNTLNLNFHDGDGYNDVQALGDDDLSKILGTIINRPDTKGKDLLGEIVCGS